MTMSETIWQRPQTTLGEVQPKHLLVQEPMNAISRCCSAQIKLGDREGALRARYDELTGMSSWTRFFRGLNSAYKVTIRDLGVLEAEKAALRYEIDVSLRMISGMLGSGDDYLRQIMQAIGG